MWSFFKSKVSPPPLFKTDVHSHLLPGIDDGVKSLEDSLNVLKIFSDMGLTKAITTPHIMSDYYRNNPVNIKGKLKELNQYLVEVNFTFTIEAAAEYYFDEAFFEQVKSNEELLTFGDNFILFETNTFSEPLLLDELIFQLKVKNYKPVLAHPERYQYLHNNKSRIEDLVNRGVYLQVNSLSLLGFYSKPIQQLAVQLLDSKMIHLLGSDCHNPDHARHFKKCLDNKFFNKALELPLLNYTL